MILKKCMLTRNDCFTLAAKINGRPAGIVVHSTGANNPYLRRYVQPAEGDLNYDEVITDLGVNQYNNHFNTSFKAGETKQQACVHAFIGKNAVGDVEVYQTLPFDYCAWGVGDGAYGSYNWNPQAHIQFEICEDALCDEEYFKNAFGAAAQFCAYLCNSLNISPEDICSHAESFKRGYGENHADCDHWLKRFGKTMDDFRENVHALLGRAEPDLKPEEKIDAMYSLYTAASGWLDRVTNYNDIDYNGYAGYMGQPAQALKAFASRGSIKYRAHDVSGVWHDWVTDCNDYDYNGYAGMTGVNMDGVQMSYEGDEGKKIRYRVHLLGGDWLDWVTEFGDGDDGYAGWYGKPIDAIQCEII